MELGHWPGTKLSSIVMRPACMEDQERTSVDWQVQKHGQLTWNYIREIGVILLSLILCTLVGWLLPANLKSSHLVFGAFFLLVFAIAIRFQRVSAYSAGIFAALAYGGLFLLQSHGITFYSLIEPFLLLFVAVITHDLLHAQQQRLHTTEQQYAQLEELWQDTMQRYEKALETNRLLGSQYTTREFLTEAPKGVSTLVLKDGGGEQYAALLDIIALATDAWSCAFYRFTGQSDGQLSLLASRAPQDVSYPAHLEMSDPLIDKVLQRLDICSVRDLLLEGRTSSQCSAVIAAPLFGKNKRLIGIIVIAALPLTRFTSGTIEQLRAILDRIPLLVPMPSSSRLVLDDDEETERTLIFAKRGVAAKYSPIDCK